MSKVGILGGSFNPIHNGHLAIANEALKSMGLDYILIMPNRNPKYKEILESDNDDRADMVKLAVKNSDKLIYSDLELKREGATYTVDTLRELHKLQPDDEFYFIMGADSLLYFEEWRCPDEIASLAYLLVAIRGDGDYESCIKKRDSFSFADKIIMLNSPDIPISSTDIRNRVKQGLSIDDLVPDSVKEYIIEHDLYKG
ncbi:MAG: nicotinate-nucleotide adenylyltransferase [Lachnospiraceae bacterium]|nr:nicotinate-nucleotide adenylyltransferase [Lachnospiraceae bacterium]